MSVLIAIEGIDGSGKGTQATRLVEALRASGRRCGLLSFPRYRDTEFGRKIGEFLNGRFGQLDQVSPFLVALLFAGDRFESKQVLSLALSENDVVVCDRYVASNIAHQAAKLEGNERDELIAWVHHVEHTLYGLPRPDRTIFLDLPVNHATQLIALKSRRSYTECSADLQEADAAYLQRVRDVYLQLASTDPIWQRVESVRIGEQRSIAEISDDIFGRILPFSE